MYFWRVQNYKQYNVREVIERIQSFCAIQDRSQFEVKNKMKSWGVEEYIIDNILSDLITEKFIDDHRFAISFCRGKFRIKKWGKIKIINELKKKNILHIYISKGIQEINDTEYMQELNIQFQKKKNNINEKNEFIKNKKIASYLINKGYESNFVWDKIRQLKQ